jgi:hypothetical protein
VCTENSVLIDDVTESLNVGGDDRSVVLLPTRVGVRSFLFGQVKVSNGSGVLHVFVTSHTPWSS